MISFPNAKINIGLQVLGKRPDGYHELETVFYPIALYDALEIIEAKDFNVFVTGLKMPSDSGNICEKTYAVMRDLFDLPAIHIHLHKAIPIGAGLGGGSADAAFLIKLLNDRFDLGMSVQQMQDVARTLGADCAFFIGNNAVYATGRGDVFTELEMDLGAYSIAIVKPDIHVSTAEAFGSVNATNSSSRSLIRHIASPLEAWRKLIVNDFERVIFERYPTVERIKDELYQAGAVYASMSGTGSAVFGIFENRVTLPALAKCHQVLYC